MPDKLVSPSSGLSNSDLAKANAGTGDVIAGKTFYAGDKNLKTGTMANHGAWGTTINPGGSVAIPAGYHNGSGRVNANNVQSQLKAASFNLSLSSSGVAYGETKDTWWSPGGTVIGMTRCQIRTDTESGESSAESTYCEVTNGQIHFVTKFTHRGGQAYVSGNVVFI